MPQNSIDEAKRSVTTDYILMLCAPLAVAIFTHGITAIINVALSLVTCLFFTALGKNFFHSDFPPKSLHSFVIGISVALLLPASAPWWLIILTAGFAMGVCVLPFGNPDNAPFIPSATALCFSTLCWPELIYNYSDMDNSIGKMLLYGNSIDRNIVSIAEALVGNVPSAIGTGCILALLGSLIFLVIRRPKDSISVFAFICSCCVMAIIFPRVSTGRLVSVIMELCSGMIIFGAIFFISSPNFAPKRTVSKLLWGFASGIICMFIRYASPLEEGACFGFVIACSLSDLFDNVPLTRKEKKKIKALEPYIETEAVSVVPDEILEEIPDMSAEEIIQQIEEEKTVENEKEDEDIAHKSENLDTVISEENTVTEQESPFNMGGDDNV